MTVRADAQLYNETETQPDGTEKVIRKAVAINVMNDETGELLKSLDLTICTQASCQCLPRTEPSAQP